MNLYEQGMRFVVRVVESRIQADWMHPADVKPEWLDCTDMDDDTFANEVQKLRLWLERRREQV
jgi:hypothetical protein